MKVVPGLPHAWGATEAELLAEYPCDRHLPSPDDAVVRAIDVGAPASITFRWVCQLRVAPYSYDWIDNRGRKSPPELTPGLEQLAIGQTLMTIFELLEFEDGRHVTARTKDARAFGHIVGSYVVQPVAEKSSRIIVKLAIRYPRSVYGALLRRTLLWGDLIMMRKQLYTLKRFAERTGHSRAVGGGFAGATEDGSARAR